jgi:membrane-bound ClpP family serine protease
MGLEERELEVARSLGRLEAQVRELIHDNNKRAQRNMAIDQILGSLQGVPEQISSMETRINERLVALETAGIARATREGLLYALIRSPVVVWLLGVAGLVWAFLTGKINIHG